MGRTKRMRAGVVGLALGAALTMGAGAAVAQDSDEFYPATPEVEVEADDVERNGDTDESSVLPAAEEQPAGAPDAADVRSEALPATGVDTVVWAVAGLAAIAVGGVAIGATRRRGSRA